MTIAEVNRYIFFCIDPVVYFIFVKEVREMIFKPKQATKYDENGQGANLPMSAKKEKKMDRNASFSA